MLDFPRFKTNQRTLRISKFDDELPIRTELWGVEQLQRRAEELAATHTIFETTRSGRNLLARLDENHASLVKDYRVLTEAAEDAEPLSPSAEWLIDNFHIIEEQLREVREDLPKSFYRELPKLGSGEFEDFPRIFHLAIEVIAHSDKIFEAGKTRSLYRSLSKTHS